MYIFTSILLVILGFILLIKGADFLVDGSSSIAKRFHIPEIVIGLTIVSIGTSLPELFVSVTSALGGKSDMALGNVIGSNICNLLLILGISSSISPLKLKRETRLIEIPLCLIYTIIFLVMCNTSNLITKPESITLLILFLAFISYTIVMGIKGEKFDEEKDENVAKNQINKNEDNSNKVNEKSENKKKFNMLKNISLIALGIVMLKFGGDFVVENATNIAKYFSISEQIISLTIVAIGTSLPELVTSVVAAIKGNSDISIGNILGSNIFNMVFIIGIASFINPIAYSSLYNIDMAILIVANIILAFFPIIPPKNEMSRSNGIVYIIMYIVYTAMLLGMK